MEDLMVRVHSDTQKRKVQVANGSLHLKIRLGKSKMKVADIFLKKIIEGKHYQLIFHDTLGKIKHIRNIKGEDL